MWSEPCGRTFTDEPRHWGLGSKSISRKDDHAALRNSPPQRLDSPDELKEAAGRSGRVGDDMPESVRWIRSYVLEENAGSLGTVCIYEATSPAAIREHAGLAGLPVDEIIPIADTVVIRPDPVAATA